MSSFLATDSQKCTTCHKEPSPSTPLKACANCKTTLYCSRECQKADWKHHKHTCNKTSNPSPASTAAQATQETNNSQAESDDWPAQRMPARLPPNTSHFDLEIDQPRDIKSFVKNSTDENLVYRLLIDSFRILDETDRGVDARQLLYEGVQYLDGYSLKKLQKHLDSAEKDVVPEWWDEEKRRECEELAREWWHWSDIETGVPREVNEPGRYGGVGGRAYLRELGIAITGGIALPGMLFGGNPFGFDLGGLM
ncbi:hypothetical protein BDV96DRAFT_595904 [Lophiotrema nucula]|uniref:MYND-type domain-containing protein n=1 Tax=Lophiotrema nucula TaxID=690887 RepID=A0A6A5ZL51_9PLEO|nr:hypothetical protein BDV96DRAFT_595904 [Lophiotrema nucula]